MKLVRLMILLGCSCLAAPALAAPAYSLTRAAPLGAPDRWDYVVFDAASHRVFVAHSDRLTVVDGRTGTVVGQVEGIAGGAHGTAISTATGQGFTDSGRDGLAIAFDLKTLKITKPITVEKDADAMVADDATGRVFVVEGGPGKVTVIDPASDTVTASVTVGEDLEYAAADGKGSVYVAGKEKREVVRIDARTAAVLARWPAPDCASPHGLAIDRAGRRLFMGCVNGLMMVMDADTGRIVGKLAIGRGSDAVAYDPGRRRVFSSNGQDGTISVYQQASPDSYRALEPVVTAVSGRTMAVDPQSGRLFVAAADTEPPAAPGGRARPRPGSLRLLMFDPVGK